MSTDSAVTKKKSRMMFRSSSSDLVWFIATRRRDPLSNPLVYQEPSARSLLSTHRSRLRTPRRAGPAFRSTVAV